MVPLDQSAGPALASAKRKLSGRHCNGPAFAITHLRVSVYTSPTISGAVGCDLAPTLSLP